MNKIKKIPWEFIEKENQTARSNQQTHTLTDQRRMIAEIITERWRMLAENQENLKLFNEKHGKQII